MASIDNLKVDNLHRTALASDVAAGATTLEVVDASGFPTVDPLNGEYFYASLVDTQENLEIVRIGEVSGTTLTLYNGATVQSAFASLDGRVETWFVAEVVQDIQDYLSARAVEKPTVMDFGAVGDGVADDTEAVQAAVNAGGSLQFPEGEYRVTDTIVVPIGADIQGTKAVIVADALGVTKDVFSIAVPTTEGVLTSITDLTFKAKNSNARYAISTPKTSTTTFKPRYNFSGLLFRGSNTVVGGSSWEQDYGFTADIRLADCMSADLRDIQIWGTYDMDADAAASPEHTGIYLDGVESLRNVVIDNYLTSDLKYAIDVGDKNTSVYLSNVDCARSWYGIRTVTTNSNGEFFATGCTFNAQFIGVELLNRSWSVLQGVHATRHSSSFDHGGEWKGFSFKNVNNTFVSNCRALHPGTWTNVSSRIGFDLDDVLFSKFVNVLCSSSGSHMEYGFKIYNTSTDLMFDNVFFDDVGVWWDFGVGTTDVRIGGHTHRGAYTTKYQYDASITNLNKIQGFDINRHQTNIDSGLFAVDGENRRIGVGTESPSVDLHIKNGTARCEARVQGAAASASSARLSLLHHDGITVRQWDVKGETNGQFVIRDVTNGVDMLNIDGDYLRFGTHQTIADSAVTGYIEMKDNLGVVRRLAVI